jgi:antitoxin (DNA-binding transcriptional repressor) of toxin-antitoxin stability system
MDKMVNIHEAKTNFSRLVQSIRDGSQREIVIAVGGKPAARLVRYESSKRPLGMDEGLVWISDDFDADDDEIIALFEGGDSE